MSAEEPPGVISPVRNRFLRLFAVGLTTASCGADDQSTDPSPAADVRWPDPYDAPVEAPVLMGVEFEGEFFVCCGDRGDGQIVAAIFGDEGWRLTDGVGPDYGTVLEIAVVEDEVEVVLEDGVLYWRPHRDDQWRGEETGSDATRDTIVSGVRFVHTDAEIRSQCERDAATLGWAVPCPSVLPGVESPESCARTCVYTGGDPPIPMFYLSIDNFPGPEPEGIATVRHLVIEAFPQGAEGVLDPPCVEASALPPLATKRGDLEMFRCGERTGANEGLIRHGEAVNQHHDGVRWYRDGIAYAVTLHRGGLEVNEILRRVVDGIEYVG